MSSYKCIILLYLQVGLIAINVLGQHIDSPSTSSASSEQDKPHSEQNNNGVCHEAMAAPPAGGGTNNGNNNALLLVNNPQYTSPYDDLAFEMYVDQEVAKIIRAMEAKKQEAVICKLKTILAEIQLPLLFILE